MLTTLLISGCSQAPAPTSQASPELAATAEAWEQAFNDRDIDALVGLNWDDVRVMPPNAEMEQGRDAVARIFQGYMDEKVTVNLEEIESTATADIGYQVGTYELTAEDGSIADRGKYISTWHMRNGEWRMSNDIWNSDMPLPEAGESEAAASAGTDLLITHKVDDRDHWVQAWTGPDSRRAMFAEHGAPDVEIFGSPDDPQSVGLLVKVTDMDAFNAYLNSEEGAKAKAEDGVQDDTIRVQTPIE